MRITLRMHVCNRQAYAYSLWWARQLFLQIWWVAGAQTKDARSDFGQGERIAGHQHVNACCILAHTPCGYWPHSVSPPCQIPVGRQRRQGDFGNQKAGTTVITLADGREWKRMYDICIFRSKSWLLIYIYIYIYKLTLSWIIIISVRRSDKTISLIYRINLNSGDFCFTKYYLNGFRNHKYIYILFNELTNSIHSN